MKLLASVQVCTSEQWWLILFSLFRSVTGKYSHTRMTLMESSSASRSFLGRLLQAPQPAPAVDGGLRPGLRGRPLSQQRRGAPHSCFSSVSSSAEPKLGCCSQKVPLHLQRLRSVSDGPGRQSDGQRTQGRGRQRDPLHLQVSADVRPEDASDRPPLSI